MRQPLTLTFPIRRAVSARVIISSKILINKIRMPNNSKWPAFRTAAAVELAAEEAAKVLSSVHNDRAATRPPRVIALILCKVNAAAVLPVTAPVRPVRPTNSIRPLTFVEVLRLDVRPAPPADISEWTSNVIFPAANSIQVDKSAECIAPTMKSWARRPTCFAIFPTESKSVAV